MTLVSCDIKDTSYDRQWTLEHNAKGVVFKYRQGAYELTQGGRVEKIESYSDPDANRFQLIPVRTECYDEADAGRSYVGTLAVSGSGARCVPWERVFRPFEPNHDLTDFSSMWVADSNLPDAQGFCRFPVPDVPDAWVGCGGTMAAPNAVYTASGTKSPAEAARLPADGQPTTGGWCDDYLQPPLNDEDLLATDARDTYFARRRPVRLQVVDYYSAWIEVPPPPPFLPSAPLRLPRPFVRRRLLLAILTVAFS